MFGLFLYYSFYNIIISAVFILVKLKSFSLYLRIKYKKKCVKFCKIFLKILFLLLYFTDKRISCWLVEPLCYFVFFYVFIRMANI